MPAGFTYIDDSSVTPYIASTGVITDLTLTPVMPPVSPATAGGTGIRNYLAALTVQNTSSTASQMNILDGSTVIFTCSIPGSMSQPMQLEFRLCLRSSVGNAINVQMGTAGTNLIWNAQGFSGSF